MQETWVWSLGWEDPLEKGKTTHSSILAWRIPWGRLRRVGHDWATFTFKFSLWFSISYVVYYPLWVNYWVCCELRLNTCNFCSVPFPMEMPGHLCWKSHTFVGLFLDCLSSVDLYFIFVPKPYCYDDCSFVLGWQKTLFFHVTEKQTKTCLGQANSIVWSQGASFLQQ